MDTPAYVLLIIIVCMVEGRTRAILIILRPLYYVYMYSQYITICGVSYILDLIS